MWSILVRKDLSSTFTTTQLCCRSTLNEVASGLQQISNPSGPTRKRPRENPPPDSIPNPSTDHWENYIGPLDKLGLDTEFMKTIDMWASAPSGYK